jgi:hypothetical protein
MTLFRTNLILILSVIIIGCASPVKRTPDFHTLKKRPDSAGVLADHRSSIKVKQAFSRSTEASSERAKWFDRSEAVDLTIIGPVYDDVTFIDNALYQKFYGLLEKISADKTTLDRLGHGKISDRYRSITFIPYRVGSPESEKINAVYANRLYDKDQLNDVLRSYTSKKDYQEMSIAINSNALANGLFALEGYKTVRYGAKKQNSHYYNLIKPDVKRVENQIIIDALLTILKLPIPEYISIERNDIMGKTALKIVNPNTDGSHTATVYKMQTDLEIEKLNVLRTKELEATPSDAVTINKKYDEYVANIRKSEQWITYQTRQLLHTTPMSQGGMDTLYQHHYLDRSYDANKLLPSQAERIGFVMGTQLPDFYLTLSYDLYKTKLNSFGVNIASVKKIVDTYYVKGEKLTQHEQSAESKASVSNFFRGFANVTLSLMARSSMPVFDSIDVEYTSIKEDLQEGPFYPVSQFAYAGIGLKKIYQAQMGAFDHSLQTIPSGTNYVLTKGTYEIGLPDENDDSKYNFYNMRTHKPLYTKSLAQIESEETYTLIENNGFTSEDRYAECVTLQKKMIDSFDITTPNNNRIEVYRCTNKMNLFDENDNLVTQIEEHNKDVLEVDEFSEELFITQGMHSHKIWDLKALDFLGKEF